MSGCELPRNPWKKRQVDEVLEENSSLKAKHNVLTNIPRAAEIAAEIAVASKVHNEDLSCSKFCKGSTL